MEEHGDCGWMKPHVASLLFPSLRRLGLPQGAGNDLLHSPHPAANTPEGPSPFLWPSVCLFFLPVLLTPLFLLLIASAPLSSLISCWWTRAALNAKKHRALSYITSSTQLMSWSVSAVSWGHCCLERQRACWVGQYVKSCCWAWQGIRILVPFPLFFVC